MQTDVTKDPLISIIIPVKNAEPWLENQLKSFAGQTLYNQTELLYIDSGSTDRTLDILKEHGIPFLSIPPSSFNHGETRNIGVQHTKGQYVVFTVQDAWPSNHHWLEKLMEGFVDDDVMAVCGLQIIPNDRDKNPVQWFNPSALRNPLRREQYTEAQYRQLNPEQKRFACNLDNVNTMYKRATLVATPFSKTVFGEDVLWGKYMIEKGKALVYTKHANVFHYHHEDYSFAFKRSVAINYLMYQSFGLLPDERKLGNSLKRTLSFIKKLSLNPRVRWSDRYKWLRYNLKRRKAFYDAAVKFKEALSKGEQELDRFYTKYCHTSPMAKHRTQ